jgi:acetylornithine/N-succinyldiaminopimelate aminotransferase
MEAKTSATTPPDQAPRDEQSLLAAADRHLLRNYRPQRVMMARGEGSEVFDSEGRRYLDFCAGVAVCALGHGHPELSRVIAEQAGRLMQVSNYYYNLENVLLAERLCQATGFDRAFFCNSGTEANEALFKLVRRHFHEQGDGARKRLLCFERAFHGRTIGSLALTGNPAYQVGFDAAIAGIEHLPYGQLDAVRERMGSDVAAVLVEPLQGEGGVNVPPPEFLAGLRSLCDEHGALLVADEVQTGMGRTGKLLAMEHSGVRVDALTLAKGLGGGFPIGALLLREPLAGGLPPGSHGSTFGGNPLGSAAARTVLEVVLRDDLAGRAQKLGERLGAGLDQLAAQHPTVCSAARGLGLLRAVGLRDVVTARQILPVARENGLLITAAGAAALRFTPPLTVTEDAIDEALELADKTLAQIEQMLEADGAS